ncbi:MAG: hypothetical protein LBR05_03655 [Azoarcus sp.]|nr:hypothetical protein [Azoarcus sp.]
MTNATGWRPITEDELALEVARAYAALPEDDRRDFQEMRIPFRKLRCQRDGFCGEETLFAIAQKGRQYIIYDDAEGEFGLAVLSEDESEVLHFWVLTRALSDALAVLENGDYSNCLVAP